LIGDLVVYAGGILLLSGAVFTLIAAIGILRLPDLLTRMHAASKAGMVGGGLVLVAVALVSFDGAVAVRALIGITFLVLTTPVAAHLLARSNIRAGEQMEIAAERNEMKEPPQQASDE
jgi:multicomponent Na+:H+ antiporter subunit G